MTPNNEPITILVAEDDPEDRMFIEDALNESRIANNIFMVRDGEECMDFLKHRGAYSDVEQYPRPGLILLDLNMPRKDGREVIEEVKVDPDLRQIPIVVLTTSQAEEDILRSYDLGVNSFITKPVSFVALVEVMKTLGKYWFEIVHLPHKH